MTSVKTTLLLTISWFDLVGSEPMSILLLLLSGPVSVLFLKFRSLVKLLNLSMIFLLRVIRGWIILLVLKIVLLLLTPALSPVVFVIGRFVVCMVTLFRINEVKQCLSKNLSYMVLAILGVWLWTILMILRL